MTDQDTFASEIDQGVSISDFLAVRSGGPRGGLDRVTRVSQRRGPTTIKLPSGRERLTWCTVPNRDYVTGTY